jgi:hypothetical protein
MTKPLYLIEASFGRLGRAFIETDRDENSRQHVISLIATGEANPVKVLEVCEDEGWVRDVTDDILREAENEKQNIAERAWERHCEAFHDGGATQFKSLRQQQIEAMGVK